MYSHHKFLQSHQYVIVGHNGQRVYVDNICVSIFGKCFETLRKSSLENPPKRVSLKVCQLRRIYIPFWTWLHLVGVSAFKLMALLNLSTSVWVVWSNGCAGHSCSGSTVGCFRVDFHTFVRCHSSPFIHVFVHWLWGIIIVVKLCMLCLFTFWHHKRCCHQD